MTVFVDVDTQVDFVLPAGALYVPGAERILPRVSALNRYAVGHGIPLISTMDAHRENDAEFRQWPPHCVANTLGQRKPESTLAAAAARIPLDGKPRRAPQMLLEKVQLDCFTNPHLAPLLDDLGATRYVVYGVVTEICVRCAAFGLLARGGIVELAADATRSLDGDAAQRMFDEFRAAGGIVTSAAAILAA